MSALPALRSLPLDPPAPVPLRAVEVGPDRRQRRARPRLVYAIVTMAGLFAVLIAQLLLSILVSDGAYEITALQQQQRELDRDEQVLTEQLNVLESPQHLVSNAVALGMVGNSTVAFLRLADGTVLGSVAAASGGGAVDLGGDGVTLVQNTLLGGVELVTGAEAAVVGTGAPETGGDQGSVASTPEGLPAPKTR